MSQQAPASPPTRLCLSWLSFYFRWAGRIDRSGLLGGLIVVNFFATALGMALLFALLRPGAGRGFADTPQFWWLYMAPQLPASIATTSLLARRIHDLGFSAKWLVPFFVGCAIVALVGAQWPSTSMALAVALPLDAILLWLLAWPGQMQPNKYGSPQDAKYWP